MQTYSKKVHNLQTLDLEINRLQQRSRQLEEKMDENLDYLQENYTSMVIGSFLPMIGRKTGLAGILLQFFLQNQRLRKKFSTLTDFLFNKAFEGLDFLLDKLSSKKPGQR